MKLPLTVVVYCRWWHCRHCGDAFERAWKGHGTKPSVCFVCNRRGRFKHSTAEQRKAINARYRARTVEQHRLYNARHRAMRKAMRIEETPPC